MPMDLIQILKGRIESLDEGPYTGGLRAVLQHVQVAANHLRRGADVPDDSAFTDTIYRTNQAFEGSLKEAYRVLAGQDPDKARPYDIETFLQRQGLLRTRVLEQMSRYRTEWRNPSTHDYKLDFDEDEALLAIVSVCAFAVVLIDQIAEKVSFNRAKAVASAPPPSGKPFVDLVVDSLLALDLRSSNRGATPRVHESHLIGAIAGHLEATLPHDASVTIDAPIGDGHFRADLIVELKGEKVLLEIKLTRSAHNLRGVAISQLSRYIATSGIRQAILAMFDDGLEGLERRDHELPGIDARIIILAPPKRNAA